MSAIVVNPTMHRPWSPLLVVALGTWSFDLLFWKCSAGLNLMLFTGCVVGFLIHRRTWAGLSVASRWALLGALVSGTMVFVHDSTIAVIAAVVTLTVAAAFTNEPGLRSLFFAGVQGVGSFVVTPFTAIAGLEAFTPERGAPSKVWRWSKLVVFPMLLLLLFMELYRAGNPRFDALTAGFMDGLLQWIGDALKNVFTAHTLFILFGAMVCSALLLRTMPDTIVRLEQGFTDVLVRVRSRRPHWMAPQAMDPLERERRMGMILLVAANCLLVVVNVIDINWIWFGFVVPQGFSLKQFVHEGTWILIISILLSMLILMHLFRKNQNFYRRSQALKVLAIVWVVQNFILGISVFLRNYHYISFHGLAYKRIGVIVFLLLVMVGLISLLIKIRERKSLFYLARVNGWAAFVALVGLSTVDWDSVIVRYNLDHWNQGEIDVDNYLEMSDKVLPLLYADIDKVGAQMLKHKENTVRWVNELDISSFRRALDVKRDRFIQRHERSVWQEVNLADHRTARSLDALVATDRTSP
jgi:hypothetical protein